MSKNSLASTVELNDVPAILGIAYRVKRTVNIIGRQGVGKSQIVRQYAKDNGFKSVIDLRLGQMEVGDLVGIPGRVENKDGSFSTVWARPDWFPSKGKHLIFLDEWNRAGTVDVIQAIFQLILDRKLHTHELPDECQVVCAMNPADKGFMVNKIKDKALWDRMVHLNVVPTDQEFFKWAKDNIHRDVHDFARASTAVLGDRTFVMERRDPSARALEILSDFYKAATPEEWDKYGSTIAAGIIGSDFSVQFVKFLADRNYKPLRVEEVLGDLDKHMDKVNKWVDPNNLRLDVLNGTLENIKDWLGGYEDQAAMDKAFSTKAKKAILETYKENHKKFCSLLPVDLIQKHIKEVITTKTHVYSVAICEELVNLKGVSDE